ncbi:MAG: glutamine amidotransferase [bacterium]|nr:glutamine amidotransferase [bacterium]
MGPVAIVKVGSAASVTGPDQPDFETWIADGMGLMGSEVMVFQPHLDEVLPDPSALTAVVVTGSAAMVTDRLAWSERTAEWLQKAVPTGIPILGICYGHQLLAHALGGSVDYNPRGREIGTVEIHLNPAGCADPLLGELPAHFLAQTSHSQSVVTLPEGARLLASNGLEPHHVFAFGASCWGVQFHPEFPARFTLALINHREKELLAEGLDVAALRAGIRETPGALSLLKRFSKIRESHRLTCGRSILSTKECAE